MRSSKKFLAALLAVSLTSSSMGVYAATTADRYKAPNSNIETTEKELVHKKHLGITAELPSQITGVWEGTYVGNQGETSLKLTFGEGTATFEFGPTLTNKYVPRGSFLTLVEYDNQTGSIELKGVRWIDRPLDYYMVDLVGSVSPSGYINGAVTKVEGAFYNTFSVKRIE